MFRVENFGPTRRLTLARGFGRQLFYHCHAYLIDGLLIDTGCPSALRPFQGFLDNESVRQAVITHYHEDHAGNVISLNLSGIPVFGPARSIPKVQRGIVNQYGKNLPYALLIWGKSDGGEVQPLPLKVETDRHLFEAIPSPGHSDDMTLFYERSEGWLFSGDLFIAERKSYWRKEEDPEQTMAALEAALRLDFDSLFCGHTPTLAGGKAALRRKLDYLSEIREKARRLSRDGLGVPEITKRLLGGEGFFTYLTLGDFSRRRLIEGLL